MLDVLFCQYFDLLLWSGSTVNPLHHQTGNNLSETLELLPVSADNTELNEPYGWLHRRHVSMFPNRPLTTSTQGPAYITSQQHKIINPPPMIPQESPPFPCNPWSHDLHKCLRPVQNCGTLQKSTTKFSSAEKRTKCHAAFLIHPEPSKARKYFTQTQRLTRRSTSQEFICSCANINDW